MRRFQAAALVFAGAVLLGTLRDPEATRPMNGEILQADLLEADLLEADLLEADLHVHPYPGDGSLPVWELQREARRRGLDVIAITGHNNRVGLDIGRMVRLDPDGPMVLPGQEITATDFHMIAVGVTQMIDWRLPAREAIAAVHAQGGVAIAAHPLGAWGGDDADAFAALDGIEVAHPIARGPRWVGRRLGEFFQRVRAVNPDVAPIGSTDFHMTAPLGLCRTYLLTRERTPAGVLTAIRQGRTVARDATGRLFGAPEYVSAVERHLASAPSRSAVSLADRLTALTALAALAVLAMPTRPRWRHDRHRP